MPQKKSEKALENELSNSEAVESVNNESEEEALRTPCGLLISELEKEASEEEWQDY